VSARARPVSPTGWILLPAAAAFAAAFVFATPVRFAGLQLPEPVFALVPAYVWALERPSAVAPMALAGLGMGLDLLWGTPLGLWSCGLLAAYAAIFLIRPMLAGQEFWVLGGAYVAACAAAFLIGLTLVSLKAGRVPDLIGVGAQFLVTVLLYPFAWKLAERYESAEMRY
jgi:rod shape-determining protein MreD